MKNRTAGIARGAAIGQMMMGISEVQSMNDFDKMILDVLSEWLLPTSRIVE